MSNFPAYTTKTFSPTQKFFVLDPNTGSPAFVMGSDLVAQLTPNSSYVFAESTRTTAQATDYELGAVIQTGGATAVGDNLAGVYLVVPAGDGDFPMDNGLELLTLAGDDTLREQLASFDAGDGSDLLAHTGTTETVTETLDQHTDDINKRTIYVGSVAELESLPSPITGQEAIVSGCPFKYSGSEWAPTGFVTPEAYGAIGDGVADDYTAITSALGSGARVLLMSLYGTGQEIKIPDYSWCHGIAENTGFKWVGAAPASVPDKTGGTAVIGVASATPSTVPVANVDIGDFKVECAFTENLIGTKWIYATLQSKGNHIAVRDIGVNGFGHYFSFEYYASFDSLSARGGSTGSVGFYLSTNWNQINGVPFKNCQVGNAIDTSVVFDTSDAYIYQLNMEGTFESGITAFKHIGGFGVRQGRVSAYTEGYSGDVIDWSSPASPSDRTGPILWENCQFFAGASVNIEEGNHSFEASGELSSVTASNNSRAFIEGNAAATLTELDTAVIRRNITVTARPNANKYASLDNDQLSAQTSNALLASGAASSIFPVPSGLLLPVPANGYSIKLVINGRRTYAGVEKYWEGWLTLNNLGNWVLTKYSFSSADDAAWAVSVNSANGDVTVDFNATDGKIVEVMWIPS